VSNYVLLGVLVVNVTWREKSYVGTLLDCTQHDWAPPLPCEYGEELDWKIGKVIRKRARGSVSDSESHNFGKLRNGKGRKTNNSGFTVPSSPKSDSKKKTTDPKRLTASSPVLIECPEPNCDKKYKHINGLKYHQTHAHGELRAKREELNLKSSPTELSSMTSHDSGASSTSANANYPSSPSALDGQAQKPLLKSEDSYEFNSGYSDISDDNEDSLSDRFTSNTESSSPQKGITISFNNGPQFCRQPSTTASSPASDSLQSFVFKSSSSPNNVKSSSITYPKEPKEGHNKRSLITGELFQYSGRVKTKADRKDMSAVNNNNNSTSKANN